MVPILTYKPGVLQECLGPEERDMGKSCWDQGGSSQELGQECAMSLMLCVEAFGQYMRMYVNTMLPGSGFLW